MTMYRASFRHVLLCGVFAAALFAFAQQAGASDDEICILPEQEGKQGFAARVIQRAILPPSSEKSDLTDTRAPGCGTATASTPFLPFRITVDGEAIAAEGKDVEDALRCTDTSLQKADIQVRFDGLEFKQSLNLSATPEGAVRGEEILFIPYSNYAAFIRKAEIRIFVAGESTQKAPLAILSVSPRVDGKVSWSVPANLDHQQVQYLLRVYDDKGRFDETRPKVLDILDKRRPTHETDTAAREKNIGYGENALDEGGVRNIPVIGGMVTVNGTNVAVNDKVRVMGMDVPVDADGKFAIRQILPAGSHSVSIEMENPTGQRAEFLRPLHIPANDWFYVALADLTVGKNNVSGPAALVTGDNSRRYQEKIYADGRVAYYLKGKIQGKWLLTSSADTREQPLEYLFSNFEKKDPQSLLKRIDPNAYYPVYGDDSTLAEDAPTSGKFYVRLERGDSHVMWGNFQTRITGTDLVNYSRSLYGANLRHLSEATTSHGERRTEADAFVADPGTLGAIEEFRGTGGSLYYLRNQDVVVGSERLRIEVRDRNSGIVLQSRMLVYGQDYEINYIQGRLVLSEALSSTADGTGLVRDGAFAGNHVFLVAGYEFAPTVTDIDNLTKGGRVSHWLNDYLRVGASVYDQNGSGQQQTIAGGDVTLRYKPGTYIKLEGAKSRGQGTGAMTSQNSGFDFGTIPQTLDADIDAYARRAEGAIDLSEVTEGRLKGRISSYWLKRDNGYSAPGQLTNEGVEQSGFEAVLPLSERLDISAKADFKEGSQSGHTRISEVSGDYKLSPENTVSLGVRHDDRETALAAGGSAVLAETGARTDAIAKVTHAPRAADGGDGRYTIYALAQQTLKRDSGRDDNDRYGAGGSFRLNDRVALKGELTGGDGGLGGLAGVDYTVNDRTSHYINYVVDTNRSDTGQRGRNSNLVSGTRSRYSDTVSVFSENRYRLAKEGTSGLIHAFGLDLTPDDAWTFGTKIERGTTSEPATGDLERTAASFSAGYHADKVKFGGTFEWRHEDGNTTGSRVSWLTKNTLAYQTSEDWRLLTGFNLALSDAGALSTADAHYTELNVGFGYRPVNNDKLNALFKYTYLSDRASPAQLANGIADTYEQRSHVLSADTIYDVMPKLSVGAKVGYRMGELRDTSLPNGEWFSSQALLGVLRADWHVVHEWDVTGEIRYLDAKEAGDAKFGALVGVYRHVNENVKIGVGYNFSDFSDDLTDLDYKSRGVFFNIVGKM